MNPQVSPVQPKAVKNTTGPAKNSSAGKARPAAPKVSTNGAGSGPGPNLPATTGTDRHEIVFRLDSNPAKEVMLAGNFTDWTKAPISMRKNLDGAWEAKVQLAPGKYHYKFLVDGEWRNDPNAALRSPNPFGTSDNVLEVP